LGFLTSFFFFFFFFWLGFSLGLGAQGAPGPLRAPPLTRSCLLVGGGVFFGNPGGGGCLFLFSPPFCFFCLGGVKPGVYFFFGGVFLPGPHPPTGRQRGWLKVEKKGAASFSFTFLSQGFHGPLEIKPFSMMFFFSYFMGF